MAASDKTKAVFEWAKGWDGLDGYLKLNAIISQDGEASIDPGASDEVIETYIDGTKDRAYTFDLRIVVPWSSGTNEVNMEAQELASDWYDWVERQYPANVPDWPGAEITGIVPDFNIPSLNAVYQNDGLAEYVIEATIYYTE